MAFVEQAAPAVAADDAVAAVSARGLTFAYEPGARPALDDLTLDIPAGEVFALLGPNGAGKSTLLSMVSGLRRADAGELRIFGQPPDARARRTIGVVFQESCLDPLMTVTETLAMQGRLFGIGGANLAARIRAVLGTMGLDDRAGERTGALSGGLRRRVELARAMLAEPRLLLLDEPTVGLDPDSRKRLWDHLLDIRERGATLLLATNDVAEADRFATTVAFIRRGRVVANGTPESLKAGLRRDAVWVDAPDLSGSTMAQLAALPGVGRVSGDRRHLHVTVDDATAFVPELFRMAAADIRSIRVDRSTLEDAYFEMAGSSLTHGEPPDTAEEERS